MNKTGIITFHNSYNCGSMLESYAMQESIKKYCTKNVKIINFSNKGQLEFYKDTFKNNSIKNILKNILILPHLDKIRNNNNKYEKFKTDHFNLTKFYGDSKELTDNNYDVIVSGSDQIWNITIPDADDAYFLNWVEKAKKVAYAPSFGAKNIIDYTNDIEKYKKYISSYDALSVRENNGKKWIKELTDIDVPVLIDPTLILDKSDYDKIMAKDINQSKKYIFFYCPSFNVDICKFVKKVADKYDLEVITWSTKSYYTKLIGRFGFKLAKYENPEAYLYYIKNAELVITTSFHGTIFSTIYKKNFFTIKNGGMYGNDDRVRTLLEQLEMTDYCIPYVFDDCFNYLQEVNYNLYDTKIKELKRKAIDYLKQNIGDINNEKN